MVCMRWKLNSLTFYHDPFFHSFLIVVNVIKHLYTSVCAIFNGIKTETETFYLLSCSNRIRIGNWLGGERQSGLRSQKGCGGRIGECRRDTRALKVSLAYLTYSPHSEKDDAANDNHFNRVHYSSRKNLVYSSHSLPFAYGLGLKLY